MLFIIITLFATILRLIYLPTIEFKTDEAINLFLASRPLFGHPFLPGATVSSFGILNPPLFLYLIFPFTYISTDPQIVSGCIAIANAIAVGLFYLFIKKYYGKLTAFFSSVLLATSPWAIIFSRKIWTQDLVLPFTIGLFFCMHKIVIDKEKKYWMGFVAFSLFLLQLHQATIFFLIPLTIIFIVKTKKINLQFAFWGLVLGLLPIIPYVIFEQTHKFQDFFLIFNAPNRIGIKNDFSVFLRPFQILNQGDFRYLFGDDIALFAQQFSLVYKLRILFYVEYFVAFVGIIILFKKYLVGRILTYATLCFILFLFLFRIPADMHYFIILMPFVFLSTGIGLAYGCTNIQYGKPISIFLFTSFSLLSAIYIISFFMFIDKKGHLNGDYGTIYKVNEITAKEPLKKYVKTKDYKEMLLAQYISVDFMSGSPTIAKMLYDNDQTKKEIPELEARLKQAPEDRRVYHQLISYYTATPPNRQTLELLREKAKTIPMYPELYAVTYNDFLNAHLRKVYESGNFGLAFEYPQHWTVTENKEAISLYGDGYIFSFIYEPQIPNQENTYQTSQTTILNQQVTETICTNKQNNWCGITYGPIMIKDQKIFLTIKPDTNTKMPDSGLIDIVLQSIRKL